MPEAGQARANIRWYASDPQPDPLVQIVDAELFWASGQADEVLKLVEKTEGFRALKLRGRVFWMRLRFLHRMAGFGVAVYGIAQLLA